MINKVMQFINEHHMIDEGDCIVAGVSGGADSVCLLFMLIEIRKAIDIEISVVHINHMIRQDAASDAAYVEMLCREHNILFTLVEKDVEALARSRHISTEEAGRNVRYEAFSKALGDRKGRIAVAHNKNDCCETFLFNLFRGTSLKGLTGIRPVRDNIIRPLLCLDRSEIELFLQERKIAYCIDSTNLEDNYSRNVIRHHIIDTAVKDISPAAVRHISQACERVYDAYALIEDITSQGLRDCVSMGEDNSYYIDCKKFCALHETIQGYVLMETLSKAAGSRKDLESVHISQLRALMDRQCGKVVELPYNLRARRDYTGILIYRDKGNTGAANNLDKTEVSESMEENLLRGQTIEIRFGAEYKISMKLITLDTSDNNFNNEFRNDLQNIPQKKYTKWIDYDKIKNSIVIRTRKQGDYLTVNSVNQRKSLKAYFIDNKIPQTQRSSICLVADGSHIIWIVGERISNYYKVCDTTRRVLCITFEGSAHNTKEEAKWRKELESC